MIEFYKNITMDEFINHKENIINIIDNEVNLIKMCVDKHSSIDFNTCMGNGYVSLQSEHYRNVNIYKLKDEWYLISDNRNGVGFDFKYYLCDQMDGLLEYIKDKFK